MPCVQRLVDNDPPLSLPDKNLKYDPPTLTRQKEEKILSDKKVTGRRRGGSVVHTAAMVIALLLLLLLMTPLANIRTTIVGRSPPSGDGHATVMPPLIPGLIPAVASSPPPHSSSVTPPMAAKPNAADETRDANGTNSLSAQPVSDDAIRLSAPGPTAAATVRTTTLESQPPGRYRITNCTRKPVRGGGARELYSIEWCVANVTRRHRPAAAAHFETAATAERARNDECNDLVIVEPTAVASGTAAIIGNDVMADATNTCIDWAKYRRVRQCLDQSANITKAAVRGRKLGFTIASST